MTVRPAALCPTSSGQANDDEHSCSRARDEQEAANAERSKATNADGVGSKVTTLGKDLHCCPLRDGRATRVRLFGCVSILQQRRRAGTGRFGSEVWPRPLAERRSRTF